MAKVALIGLDAALPSLVLKFMRMGRLPNMKRLLDGGTWAEGLPVFPTVTSSNWNTIATGAWPSSHGVTDMVVHMPREPLTKIRSGFYSDLCQAEQVWKTAERFGKKSILLKYIASWPPNIQKGIQIEGFGAPGGPGSRPWGSSPLALSNSACYSTEPLENATVVTFSEANFSAWKNLPITHLPPLETEIRTGPPLGGVNYNVLLLAAHSEDHYDTALISRNRDAKEGVLLKQGESSDWLVEDFRLNGKITKGSFRMKLLDIGNDRGKIFKLFVSQVFPLEGWTFPDEVGSELVERFGPFLESISHFPYVFRWIDEYTYLDDVAYQARWMGDAAKYLMERYEWNLFMTQWHGIDNTQHAFLRFDKSILSDYEAGVCDRVVLRSYELGDELVGNIMQAAQADPSKDVYIFALSDHGHVIGRRRFFINRYLYQKGLIKLKENEVTKRVTVDWENTLAFAQGMVHVYVNVKGREPSGAVNPGKEFEDVQEKLVDLLYEIKDPKTKMRPISLALKKTDAEFLGLGGDRVGDIIYAANPGYAVDNRVTDSRELFEDLKVGFLGGSIHGQQLPSVDLGEAGTMKSMFLANGPRIRRGYSRSKPVRMVDIAPTIAYILDIPAPKNSDGGVMYDLFE